MKKFLIIILLTIIMLLCLGCLTGCNKQIIDTTYTYDKAIIQLGDETIKVDIKKWNDYEGEQLQIISTDGTVYLVSSFNTILIKEK